MLVDEALVRALVADQFHAWSALPIARMRDSGWDNHMFRLGETMVVRIPSAEAYARQVEKEQRWLPTLAPRLPLEIPVPLAEGKPGRGLPWKWSVHRFIRGDSATGAGASELEQLACDLGPFLHALHGIDTADGPLPGEHNFQRGGPLAYYDAQARRAISALAGRIDERRASEAWDAALVSSWVRPGVWVHGDISSGNLLIRDGRLAAVIDFGNLAVGDPACDLSIAWTFFSGTSREAFQRGLQCDPGTWVRARGWALWKALIVAAGHASTNAPDYSRPFDVIDAVLT